MQKLTEPRPFGSGLLLLLAGSVLSAQQLSPQHALINQYCVTCHNERAKTAGLMLDKMDIDHAGEHAEVWEKVVRKLRGGMMPPQGMPRPDQAKIDGLDRVASDLARSGGRRRIPIRGARRCTG